ncbi:HEAT repeat domain-containing protein [Salinirubellus sp. GCM10025818]|uniref:HEAT repeat domain-containing protein n=2 Tax=Natronomonadaceae TaxID=3402413 RepID=UPI0030D17002
MSMAPITSFDLILFISVVLLAVLGATAIVTLGRAVQAARHDRRSEAVRPSVRYEIIERMSASDPGWEQWVNDLDPFERFVAKEELQGYLRQVRGKDRETLQRLGDTLGIDTWAECMFKRGDRFDQLAALTWIALLDIDVTLETLRATCMAHPDTRAAAARVLYEQDHPAATTEGTDGLLAEKRPLSMLGLDTLYQLNKEDPRFLLSRAEQASDSWPDSLLVQVLRVIGEAGPTSPDVSLDWLGSLFADDSPLVRAAVADALAGYGWHDHARTVIEIENVRRDSSPRVRQAVYRMLGSWGDQPARDALRDAIRTESDPRSAVVAIEALSEPTSRLGDAELSTASQTALAWVEATSPNTEAEAAG